MDNDQINLADMLNPDLVQKKLIEEEFTTKYNDWESADWDELEWDKVKDLRVREILAERRKVGQIAQQGKCLTCPHFVRHVSSLKLICSKTTLI